MRARKRNELIIYKSNYNEQLEALLFFLNIGYKRLMSNIYYYLGY